MTNINNSINKRIHSIKSAYNRALDYIVYLKIINYKTIADKMNFSRGVYFMSLCNYILKLSEEELNANVSKLIAEIDYQIEDIFKKRRGGGYWLITLGDRVFIFYMRQLKKILKQENPQNAIKKLLNKADENINDKVKIVFLAQETHCWPSLESLYEACAQDDRYIAQLVYIPFKHPHTDKSLDYFKIYKEEMGLPIVRHNEYSISDESPDIVVFVKPYKNIPMQYYIDDVDKVVRRCVFVGYGFEGSLYLDSQFKMPGVTKVWKYSVFGNCVKVAYSKYGKRKGENCVVWGNPRIDSIVKIRKLTIPAEWIKKINSRKVVLWTPHHTIDYGTFLEYKDVIFKYFEENKDMFLLFRPHPHMLKSFVDNKLLTEEELTVIKNMILRSDNIILDISPSYRESFSVSNAIITDGTSFLREYMLLNRPILYTTSPTTWDHLFPEMNKAYNIAIAPEHVFDFLNMVKAGEDCMQPVREEVTKQNFFMPSGGVGEYIKEQFLKSILEEENAKTEKLGKDSQMYGK